MAGSGSIQGDLQAQVMAVLWRLGAGTVEEVRSALPVRYRSAYTTVQTVLNRLANRGLLSRKRSTNVIVYRPTVTEAAYLSRSIERALASASADARKAALAQLIGEMGRDEVAGLQRLAEDVGVARKRGER